MESVFYPNIVKATPDPSRQVILIGIGGTGLTALEEVKKLEYKYLKDENENPTLLKSLHYLYVDSDAHSLNLASNLFSQEECFLLKSLSFSNHGLCRAAQALAIEYDHSSSIRNYGHDSQVGRRIARLLLVQHAGELAKRLNNIFSKAAQISSKSLDVYIIASLAGSTGGGTFIDISYIVKWLLRDFQQSFKTSVIGFFTDATEAKQQIFNNVMPMRSNDVLASNSLASFMELQLCMNLYDNNTVFCQSYDSFTINTSESPLDTYFLFGGENSPMQTMAECILSGITQVNEGDYNRLYNSNPFFSLSSMFSNLAAQRISFFSIGSSSLYAPIEQVAAALYITVLTDCGLCTDNSDKPETSSVENYGLSFAKLLVARIRFYLQTTANLELPKLTSYNAKTCKDGIPMLWMEIGSKYVSMRRAYNREIVSRMLDDIDNFAAYNYGHIPSSYFADIYDKLVSLFIKAPQGPALVVALLSTSGIPMALATEIECAKNAMVGLDTTADQYRSELAKSKFVFFFQRHYLEIATDYFNALIKYDEEECLVLVLEAIIRRIKDLNNYYFAPLSHQSYQFANFCSTILDKLCFESSSYLNDGLYQFPASPKIYLDMAETKLQNANIHEIRRALLDEIFSLSSLSRNDFADVAKMLSRICQDCFKSFLQSILENSWQAENMIVPTINRQMEFALRNDSIVQINSQLKTRIFTRILFLPLSLINNYHSIIERSSQILDGRLNIFPLNTTGRIHAVVIKSYSSDSQLCQDYYSIYYNAPRNEAKYMSQFEQNFVLAPSIRETQKKAMRTESPEAEDVASTRLQKLLMTADEGGVLTNEQMEVLANLQAIHLNNYVPGASLMLLKNLRQLKLSGREVMNTPNDIDCLHSLEVLDLSDTQISRIPPEIGRLKHLKALNLSGLVLEEFPLFLLKLPMDFTRKGNEGILIDHLRALDMEDLDILFASRKVRDVWFRDQKGVSFDDSPAMVGEIKVVFLGDAKVGKTLTIRRILKDGALIQDYKEDATRGISINTKIIETNVGNIQLRLWDFGGQDIYYAMHRLFFTEQTIYVIMVSARETNAERNACSWLSNVKTFAPDCPVLVYVNQIDQIPEPDISLKQLKKENPSLHNIYYMSALMDNQSAFISNAVNPIVKLVTEMNSGIFNNIPEPWLQVRNQIVESHRNYLMDKDYFSLCDRCSVSNDRSERNRLLSWLNNIGIGFSGSSKYLGGHYTVLDPEWITKALYFLLNYRSYFKDGIVSAADCLNLQDQKRDEGKSDIPSYYASDYNFIFESLRQFRLAYLLKDGRYMIPMLCLEENPELGEPLISNGKTLHYYISFKYLPINILYRLCVEMNASLVSGSVWKGGCIFSDNDGNSQTVVRLQCNDIHLYILSNDPTCPARVLLAHFRHILLALCRQLGLTVSGEYLVYHAEGKEEAFNYRDLLAAIGNGDTTAVTSSIFGSIKATDILNQSGIMSVKRETLLDNLVCACNELQKNEKFALEKEDARTTFLCSLLRSKGYTVDEQSPGGVSSTGNSTGYRDALFYDSGILLAIFEALNFKYNTFINNQEARKYLRSHIKKLLDNYNPTGLPLGFLVTYLNCKKTSFKSIWEEYFRFVTEVDGIEDFTVTDSYERLYTKNSFLKVLEVRYDCSGIPFTVFHILVRMITEELGEKQKSSEVLMPPIS